MDSDRALAKREAKREARRATRAERRADDAEDAARAFGWGTAALHIAFASVVSRKEFCRATERAYNNLITVVCWPDF